VKTNGDVPVPFFSAPLIDFNVQWKALMFEHSFVGEIQLSRPKMNLVNGPTEATRQAPVDEPWAQKIKQLYPLKINRFSVQDSQVHYRDFSKTKGRCGCGPRADGGDQSHQRQKLSKTLIAEVGRRTPCVRARPDADSSILCGRPTFAWVEMKEIPLVKAQ
jgi:hypothetical protein